MIPLSPAAHRVAAVVVTCALSSCVQPSLDTEYGAPVDRVLPDPSDTRYSKDIYDEFFGQYLPDYEHFGWEDADWLTADWVNSRHQPSPSAGQGNEVYHHLLDFNPFNYSRPGLTSAISATAPTTSHNASLISGGSGDTYWRQQDPLEWMPATASTYARSQYNDVMANQFWYRAREPQFRPKLQRALELCPDCDDVFTPLSHNDLYKIIEIRFARVHEGRFQLSRVFKLIGIDSSGAMETHSRNESWTYFGKIGSETVRAKWRMELSGLLAQKYWQSSTDYIRLMPVLVRTSEAAARYQYYDGRFDRESPANDPFGRLLNPLADSQCIPDCHAKMCNEGMNVAGMSYFARSNCTCGRDYVTFSDPLPSNIYAAGVCEEWPNGQYSSDPSSSVGGDMTPTPEPEPEPEPKPEPEPEPETDHCGNGTLEPEYDEECDTGAARSDTAPNACRLDCTLPSCGDGVVDDQSDEECDTGDDRSDSEPDACRLDCSAATCGDNVVDSDEECDTGDDRSDSEPDACRLDCSAATCGDDVVDTNETCDTGDDRSDTDPDACRMNCALATCGDGVVDDGEECDTGDDRSDTEPDACRMSCAQATCGDNVVDDGEDCDHGPTGTDTCTAACEQPPPDDPWADDDGPEGGDGDDQDDGGGQPAPDGDNGRVSAGCSATGSGSTPATPMLLLIPLILWRRRRAR